jgi:hypothetical protein
MWLDTIFFSTNFFSHGRQNFLANFCVWRPWQHESLTISKNVVCVCGEWKLIIIKKVIFWLFNVVCVLMMTRLFFLGLISFTRLSHTQRVSPHGLSYSLRLTRPDRDPVDKKACGRRLYHESGRGSGETSPTHPPPPTTTFFFFLLLLRNFFFSFWQ